MPPRPAFTLLALFALAPDGPPKLAVPEPFAGRIGQTVSLAQRIGDDAKFGIDLPLRVDGRRIQIPADALPGAYRLRLAGPNGVSAFRVFAADDRPIVAPSDAILTLPCTVAGIVESESTHTARVRLKAGRRLAVEAVARRLGSPLDPHLRIRDAKTGRELPGLAVDDTPGLQGDCRLTVTPDHDAELLIDLRDSTSRGGGEYRYLLRFGDFPSATCSLPLAVPRGQRSPVTFIGRDATGVDSQSVDAPADRDLMALRIAPRRGKESGWSLPLLLSDHPEIVEVEPNDTVAQATPLPMPGGASGILGRVGDRDFYRFPAKKGQSLLVRSSQAELALATDVALSILDESGKTLAASDGKDASATVRFTPPANGNYYLRVEHLQYGGGPGDAYRVTVTPSVETFRFAVAVDAVKLPAGWQLQNSPWRRSTAWVTTGKCSLNWSVCQA